MQNPTVRCLRTIIGLTIALFATACGHPRVFIATGTLVGLEATPGDPNEGQTPAVTFGYRRAEMALVPVEKENSQKVGQQDTSTPPKPTKDAASTLAIFNLAHNWFGPARIEQYVATGLAARDIVKGGQYALALIGYEQGEDPLADKLAKAYKDSEDGKPDGKACWDAVKNWMKDNFRGLPPTIILTKGFDKQRPALLSNDEVKKACPDPDQP